MKKIFLPLLATTFGLLIPAQLTHAAAIVWNGSNSTTFSTAANWDGGVAPSNSVSTDNATFSGTPVRNPNLTGTRSIKGLQFNSGSWNFNGDTFLLTLGANGIAVAAGASAQMTTPLSISQTQTWNIAGTMFINRGVAITSASTDPLIKSGAGTMALASPTTDSFASNYLRITAGTVRLDTSNVIADNVNITGQNNSIFSLHNQSDTVGNLSITSGFTIDFSSTAGANAIAFAASNAKTWTGTLTILNFEAGVDTLRFGTSSSGLTSGQLNQIQFGTSPIGAGIDSLGYVTVPEPTTAALLVISLLGTGLLTFRRRPIKE
jgi:hypothetical protein